jgi:rhodanese-related sulfurtransferase
MKTAHVLPVLFLIVAALFCTSCATNTTGGPGRTIEIVKLSPKEAYTFIQTNRNNPKFMLIDIRWPSEYQDGHIETAINMNLYSEGFETEIGKLDKGKTYMAYCRTGRRTAIAVDIMEKVGFTKVYLIAGDIVDWRSEGLPLVK